MNNNALLIVESIYNGHTLRLAQAMANKIDCRIVNADTASNLDLSQYKVIGWGSGIYFCQHHPKLIELAIKLTPQNQKAFVFCTHGNPKVGRYQDRLANALKEKNRIIIGQFHTVGFDGAGPFRLFGGGHKGRPHEGDCEKAARFIKKILPEYVASDLYLEKLKKRKNVVEGRPNIYKIKANTLAGDKVTVDHNRCDGCKMCILNCPLRVFDVIIDKAIPIREMDCTSCQLCQNFCKQHAIFLHGNKRDYVRVAIRHKDKRGL